LKFSGRPGPIARVFDIIGDVHGHAGALRHLLRRLGYRARNGAWRYPGDTRQVLFVGDFVDRGPEIPEVVRIVRRMIDCGAAQAVMGNHEYNALAWHTRGDRGEWLREHNEVHRRQHAATLQQYAHSPAALADLLGWIRGLPLFFENDLLRVVHAAWEDRAVDETRANPTPLGDDRYLQESSYAGNRPSEIVETLLKGIEMPLPPGLFYLDKEGTRRYKTRVRWWLDGCEGCRAADVAMPPADEALGETPLPPEALAIIPGYDDPRPVFVGHYWLTGSPRPLSERVACVDYSVARGGRLCAYRFDGEVPLTADRFVCV
jgi:hypothetical protein